jgi:hypothetical protein
VPMLQNRTYGYLWDVVHALLAGEVAQRNPI